MGIHNLTPPLDPQPTVTATCLVRAVLFILLLPWLASCSTEADDKPRSPAQTEDYYDPIPGTSRAAARITAQGGTTLLGNVALHIPPRALTRTLDIAIERVQTTELPPLAPGMINVTAGLQGYRFLPAGTRFDVPAEVRLPLTQNPKRMALWKTLPCHTYYWDEDAKRWVRLSESRVDAAARRLVAPIRHFTLMINAVLKTPDTTAPSALNPNSIKSIGVSDSATGVDLIAPPSANNEGTARVTFPFRLPAGRGAYSPSLSLVYSSDRENGPVGVGWSLPVSAIEVDTRWGVPVYDGSERYLLDGAALVPIDKHKLTNLSVSVDCENANLVGVFATRTQGFARILMCKANQRYHWQVTQPNGARYFYGTDDESRLSSYRPGEANHTGRWLLRRVVDTHGNTTEYRYLIDDESVVGTHPGEPFKQRYLREIAYTHWQTPSSLEAASSPSMDTPLSLDSAYRVRLQWECIGCEDRPDVISTGRLGFQLLTRLRLEGAVVEHRDPNDSSVWHQIRRYDLKYADDPADGRGELAHLKTVLERISVLDANDDFFYEHSFEYTKPEYLRKGKTTGPFAPPELWHLADPMQTFLQKPHARLTDTYHDSFNFSTGVGVAAEFGAGGVIGCSAGGSVGASMKFSHTTLRLVDVNGDGIPDRLHRLPTGLFDTGPATILVALGDVDGCFGRDCSQPADQRTHADVGEIGKEFSLDASTGTGGGCSAILSISQDIGASIGWYAATSLAQDVDGDGIMDLVAGRTFWRGLPHACRSGEVPQGSESVGVCETDGLLVCREKGTFCYVRDSFADNRPARLAFLPHSGNAFPMYATLSNEAVSTTGAREDFKLIPFAHASSLDPPPENQTTSIGPIGQPTPVETESFHRMEETSRGPQTSWASAAATSEALGGEIHLPRSVLRWDAAHTGTVKIDGRVCWQRRGVQDGVTLRFLKVVDPRSEAGTQKIAEVQLLPEGVCSTIANDFTLDVEFGNSLLLVIDPEDGLPMTYGRQFLDAVKTDFKIVYQRVCRPGVRCQSVDQKELTHRGPTGELEYVFSFPEDFSLSELPHQRYWQLLPPLRVQPVPTPISALGTVDETAASRPKYTSGMDIRKSNAESLKLSLKARPPFTAGEYEITPRPNYVTGLVKKTSETKSPVRVRVRCESFGAASRNPPEDPVCPLGTILAEHRFEPEEVGEAALTAQLPETFIDSAEAYGSGLPDLTVEVEPFRIRAVGPHDVPSADSRGIYTTRATIRNVGERTAPASVMEIGQYKHYGQSYFYPVRTYNVPQLQPGEAYTVNGRWRTNTGYGSQQHWNRAYARADLGNAIDEANESNNLMHTPPGSAQYEWPGIPGLSTWVNVLPEVPTTDDEVTISVRIINDSKVTSSAFEATIQLDDAPPEIIKVPALQPKWPYDPSHSINRGLFVYRHALGLSEPRAVRVTVVLDDQGIEKTVTREFLVVDLKTRQLQDPFDPVRLLFEVDGENGWEIPRDAIEWEPKIVINQLRPITAALLPDGETRAVDTGQSTILPKDRPIVHKPPVLFRVHPQRELVPFEVKEKGQVLKIKATATYSADISHPRYPLFVGLTADHIEGKIHAFSIQPTDVPEGARAATKVRKLSISEPGLYYIRGYTEAVFRDDASFSVKAWLCSAGEVRCPEVAVNLLTADFGSGYQMEGLVGEVAHSLDFWSGGHRGFFYGKFSGNAKLTCLGSLICDKNGDTPNTSAVDSSPMTPKISAKLSGNESEIDVKERNIYRKKPIFSSKVKKHSRFDDGDGIPEDVDECPKEPEDHDGYQDADGCPEYCVGNDTDGDGINNCDDDGVYSPGDEDPRIVAEDEKELEDIISRISGAPFNLSINTLEESTTYGLNVSASTGVNAVVVGATAGLGIGLAKTFTNKTVQDWNGDGVADFHTPTSIELGSRGTTLSFTTGCSIGGRDVCLMRPGVREAMNVTQDVSGAAWAKAVDIALRILKVKPRGPLLLASLSNQSFGVGVQGAHTSVTNDRIDINGDGLPDFLVGVEDPDHPGQSQLLTRLNFGYNFGAPEILADIPALDTKVVDKNSLLGFVSNHVAPAALSTSNNLSVSNTAGFGASLKAGIFGGGASFNNTKTVATTQNARLLVDVNGDGLVDFIEKASEADRYTLHINRGWYRHGNESLFELLDDSAHPAHGWSKPPSRPLFGDFTDTFVAGTLANLPDFMSTPDIYDSTDAINAAALESEQWKLSTEATIFFVNLSSSNAYSNGNNHQELGLRDMDGDGLPDRVLRSGDDKSGAIQVQRNLLGGGNLLKTIHRPLGGRITLSYERTKPTEEDPRSRWVLSQTVVDEDTSLQKVEEALGLKANSSQSEITEATTPITTTFSYADPFYDRFEREFYGFRTVEVERSDKQLTRYVFHNRDYRYKGLLATETLYAPEKFSEDKDAFLYRVHTDFEDDLWSSAESDCLDRLVLPLRRLRESPVNPCQVRFAHPSQMTTAYRDGTGSTDEVLHTVTYDAYDDFGNVTQMTEREGSNTQDQRVATITYDDQVPLWQRYIVDRPTTIEVRRGTVTGDLLRMRSASYNETGALTHHEVCAADCKNAANRLLASSTDYVPDDSGFIRQITDASGYEVFIQPEDFLWQLPESIEDSFGLTSSLVYDYRFQKPLQSVDANGQTLEWKYDAGGRLEKVWGPYEPKEVLGPNGPEEGEPSITVQYSDLDGVYPTYSITTNVSKHPKTGSILPRLRTATFLDGRARVIQTQVDTEVDPELYPETDDGIGRAVSGKVVFDDVGRVLQRGEPEFRAGSDMSFETMEIDLAHASSFEYDDALDRMTLQILPGGISTRWSYDIALHPGGNGVFTRRTTITDPEENIRYLYEDGLDRLVAVEQHVDTDRDGELDTDELLTTSYGYAPTGELLTIEDANDNTRHSEFDLAGRKTVIETPDTGRIEYGYDSTGNLTEWTDSALCSATTKMLRDCGPDQKVRLGYDFNRLVSIDYPTTPDVTYFYGDTATSEECDGANILGRVCKVRDAGGVELRGYGALGETTARTREGPIGTFHSDSVRLTVSETYDSFGRLLEVTYPDGEVLTYGYNNGGLLQQVSGHQEYIREILYDVYGKPVRTEYGNDVIVSNVYEPDTQRLDQQTICADGEPCETPLRYVDYDYDKASNIDKIRETRGGSEARFSTVTRTLGYDDLHQLDSTTSVYTVPTGSTAPTEIEGHFSYDPVGNLERQEIILKDGNTPRIGFPSRDWEYDYENSPWPNLPQTVGPYSFTYTERGAIASVLATGASGAPAGAVYTWNDAGHLAQSTRTGETKTTFYDYDDSGERIRKETRDPMQTVPLSARADLYASEYYSASATRTKEEDCSGPPCFVEAQFRTKSIRAGGQQVALVTLSVDPTSLTADTEADIGFLSLGLQYLHGDQVLSTVMVTDQTRSPTFYYEYLPYGEIVEDASSTAGEAFATVGFSGKESDVETGLQYFGARYYWPYIGRWMSADPLFLSIPGATVTTPKGLTLYSFAANNPIRFIERQGLQASESDDAVKSEIFIQSQINQQYEAAIAEESEVFIQRQINQQYEAAIAQESEVFIQRQINSHYEVAKARETIRQHEMRSKNISSERGISGEIVPFIEISPEPIEALSTPAIGGFELSLQIDPGVKVTPGSVRTGRVHLKLKTPMAAIKGGAELRNAKISAPQQLLDAWARGWRYTKY